MARPNTSEVRNLSDADITEKIDGLRRELFQLRFEQATRQLANTHRFKEARIKLAQLLTVQSERQRSTAS
ncbi:Ribosomal protein L29 [Synechococcus sp. BL107]|jgi:large subunit ribosomal protein L29|uniref:50S ribosomal protein L29 n=1 Tax=Synechococcus sp. BL107 TaxID=313625 RepID=UPI0000E54112|nr:50S ribosomal protein L29 [Synechococcus sp. BL107]EAU70203.1 Ribosomal protein L29 [Synechococcus sp. BL107]MDA7437466.1 50S ribosomal protein L29 [Synechococcus sp. AH-601-P06]|tara:strand:+ start:865 stop:1074 length:210 start_codon:yes stop_codon:yes gene_type:complete